MAIVNVAVSSDTQNGNITSLTIPKPTGTASGDIIIICVYVNDSIEVRSDFTDPTGFTLITGVNQTSTTGGIGAWWKRAGGSEPSSYTVSWSNSSWSATGIGASFSGCLATGDVIQAYDINAGIIGTLSYVATSPLAPNSSGDIVVAFAGADGYSSASTITISDGGLTYGMDNISWDIGNPPKDNTPLTQMDTAKLDTSDITPKGNSDDSAAYGAIVAFVLKIAAGGGFTFTPIPISTVSVA